jgi:putative colanic acid biosysnthesis UDP-glucose lipid carrier transferase
VYLGINELRRRAMAHPDAARRAVFAGCNDLTLGLAERVRGNREYGISISGFFDDRGVDRLGIGTETRLLGRLPELAEYVRTHSVDVIFIALPIRHIARVMNLLDDLRDTTASIYYVPDIFVFDLIQARTSDIGGIPVVAMCETPFQGYRGTIKRSMDLVLSAAVLLILSPVMIGAALAVGLTSRGPLIFRQRRYGLDGQQIEVYKFRTMTVMEDGHDVRQATRDDARITAVGRILRRYSLDELPQLLNVLQGNMSLVGPRPHAIAHNEQYRKLIKGYMVRHKVLPGMTGLAQINGCRGEIEKVEDMERRLNFDIEYLRRWSPLLDLNIIFLTVLRMFGDDRAY